MLISSETGIRIASWMLDGSMAILFHLCLRANPAKKSLSRIAEAPLTPQSFVMTYMFKSISINMMNNKNYDFYPLSRVPAIVLLSDDGEEEHQ